MDRLLPKSLDGKGEAKLVRTCHDEQAMAIFSKDAMLRDALAEFKPAGISAGEYNYGGILINLGLARCQSTDEAYGIYSALTAMPRERWEFRNGEMSYKSPYFAGYTGEYVFWTYSPTNPMTYAAFYRQHGERILTEFEKTRTKPGLLVSLENTPRGEPLCGFDHVHQIPEHPWHRYLQRIRRYLPGADKPCPYIC